MIHHKFGCTILLLLSVLATAAPVIAEDWPFWRGPNFNGVAPGDQKPPRTFSTTQNVVWEAAIPGRGHGSPIVVGDRVYIATAEPEKSTQSLLCLDRKTGKEVWTKVVHEGPLPKTNKKASHASGTAVLSPSCTSPSQCDDSLQCAITSSISGPDAAAASSSGSARSTQPCSAPAKTHGVAAR